MATTAAGRINMAGVCALSRRLMAIEKARALGKTPVDPRAWTLELEARRWVRGRAKEKQAVRGAQ